MQLWPITRFSYDSSDYGRDKPKEQAMSFKVECCCTMLVSQLIRPRIKGFASCFLMQNYCYRKLTGNLFGKGLHPDYAGLWFERSC